MSKTTRKGGLGKGLSSLLGQDYEQSQAAIEREIEKEGFRKLEICKIEPNIGQPRKNFDEQALDELAESIKLHGVITPITVKATENGYYQIIAGERRWRAARKAGITEIPAMILDVSEQKVMEMALIENLQRQDLDPIEEAEGYSDLMDKFGLTQEEVAGRVGKSRPAIANSLRLLSLIPEIRKMVSDGLVSSGHARAILSSGDKQLEVANAVIKKRMSVRQAESYVKRLNKENKTSKTGVEVDYLAEVERDIESVLGRKVKISSNKNKGIIELEFYGSEDLERLSEALKKLNI